MGNFLSINSPFWQFVDRTLNLIWLNMLWAVCCLPVITIGASTSALYSVCLSCIQNRESYITKNFFQAFKANFKQASIIWGLLLGIGFFLGMDLLVYLRSSSLGIAGTLLLTAFFTCVLIYVFTSIYIYAYIAVFQDTIKNSLKNSLLLSLCHWPSSILMVTFGILILCVGFLVFPPLLFLGFSLFCYINSRFLNWIFDKTIHKTATKCRETGIF